LPANSVTVKAKTKAELKKNVEKAVKKFSKNGFIFLKRSYSDARVKKSKGEYVIDIEVHT
jgi:hypothetical protein